MTPYYYMANSVAEYSRFRFINNDYLNYALFCLFENADQSGIKLRDSSREQYLYMLGDQYENERFMRHEGKKVGIFTEIQGLHTTCNNWL
jgi:hypothetical protein